MTTIGLSYSLVKISTKCAPALHVVRTLTRRCERLLLTLSRSEQLNPAILPYMNRLSDCGAPSQRNKLKKASWDDNYRALLFFD